MMNKLISLLIKKSTERVVIITISEPNIKCNQPIVESSLTMGGPARPFIDLNMVLGR